MTNTLISFQFPFSKKGIKTFRPFHMSLSRFIYAPFLMFEKGKLNLFKKEFFNRKNNIWSSCMVEINFFNRYVTGTDQNDFFTFSTSDV